MRKVLVTLLIALFLISCGNEVTVETGGESQGTKSTEDLLKEFVGSSGIIEIPGCSGFDWTVEPDNDRDGIIDKCDKFVMQRDNGQYMLSGDGHYFGTSVWGEDAVAKFTLYNTTVNPLTVNVTIEGDDPGNFFMVEDLISPLAAGTSQVFRVKLSGNTTTVKNASIRLTIDSDDHVLGFSGSNMVCLGHSEYCSRRYNEVSTANTHNAHTSEEDWDNVFSFIGINQEHSYVRQLQDGIRGFMTDPYMKDGLVQYCHGGCTWGATVAFQAHISMMLWMIDNPGSVIHFMLEDYVDVGNLAANEAKILEAFMNGGLGQMMFSWTNFTGSPQPAGHEWPEVGWMVQNNNRVVLFTEVNASADTASNQDWVMNTEYFYYPGSTGNPPPGGEAGCKGRDFGFGGAAAINKGANARNVFYVLSIWDTCDSAGEILGGCNIGGGVKSHASVLNSLGGGGGYPGIYNWSKMCWLNSPTHNPNKELPVSLAVDFYNFGGNGAVAAATMLNEDACPSTPADFDNGYICGNKLTLGTPYSSTIRQPGDVDYFKFKAPTAAAQVTIDTYYGTTGACGVDTEIELFDWSGMNSLATDQDSGNGGTGPCSRIVQAGIVDTEYRYVAVKAQGGGTGNYTIVVTSP